MSSIRLRRITLEDFGYLLSYAKDIHADKNEPIPELAQENWDKIEYALHAPFQYVFGTTLYRGFLKKATIQFYLIAKGHRLANGNKRMACVTLDYFCYLNNRELIISNEELVDLARRTAASDPADVEAALVYIRGVLKNCISPL